MIVMRQVRKTGRVDDLAFSPDGRWLASPAGAAGVHLWGDHTHGAKSELRAVPVRSARYVTFAPDGRLFAGNDDLCSIQLPDGPAWTVPAPRWGSLRFAVSAGGTLVVCEPLGDGRQSRISGFPAAAPGPCLWAVETPTAVYSAPLFLPGDETFCQVEWSVASLTRRVTRSARTGAVVDESPVTPEAPDRVALSPDGTRLAWHVREAVYDIPARGWEDRPRELRNDNKKHFTGVAFHPSGKYLAATSNDTTVKLYDTATWAPAKTFAWDIGRLRAVAFSPDGTRAAVGSDTGKVLIWDVDV